VSTPGWRKFDFFSAILYHRVMETNRSTLDVSGIAMALLRGTASLEVALSAWKEHNGLRLTDVSELIDRPAGAVSAMLYNPARCPQVRLAVAALIGYEERG